ncbi:MAG: DUF3168 domain-containing protein [Phycisphaerales bacterium]|nr:DUF3168 domain-containing protein [Phycisphaerales bacterium]
MKAALVALLEASAAGTSVSNRIYPLIVPADAALPHIALEFPGRTPDRQIDGETDRNEWTFHVTVIASTLAAAETIGNQVDAALTDYNGTASGVVFRFIRLIDDFNQIFESQDASEGHRYARTLIFNAFTKG